MKKICSFFTLLSVMLLFVKCKEAYEPEVVFTATNLLVVEGHLNGSGVTSVKLSRTQANDSRAKLVERNATVSIFDENKQAYPLTESSAGQYVTSASFPSTGKYSLHIRTSDGKEYASEEVSVLNTPDIEEVSWNRASTGVQIYVDTHDASNNTRYYRWEYEETWEIVPRRFSYYELVPKVPAPLGSPFPYDIIQRRPQSQFPRACWQSEYSKNVIMASSTKLTDDVIHLAPIAHVPNNSWKIDTRYSILVKQFALSAAGFEYWQNMKKNTEGLGSIFDPQPSEIRGNISCISDPAEQVVGFFDASTIKQVRIFITKAEVGDWQYDILCDEKFAVNHPDSLAVIFPANIPLESRGDPFGGITAYTGASPDCVDCRFRGTPVRPDFW
ncbi:uncharacterized protein DUF4249 [Arcticibacter pallidicorallinus]|uniref:Uncharacterized protein DUF4249 n=1 Tax=Arcticibacter pallidicorallinus TaxID=1259464 RepID=A0A2T0U7B6_9SPHI|nr:DUF4249 domain-containing protein [Arcticibacter pallidicorallinus]PRY53813.1 uncharacterized protein DUF4249 [Arcticibacter pallidicorallinus]